MANLGDSVRYYLGLHFNGLQMMESNPEAFLGALEEVLSKIEEFNARISEVMAKPEVVLADLFPRDFVYDNLPNPLGLPDYLVGCDMYVAVPDDVLKHFRFQKMFQPKTAKFSKTKVIKYKFAGEVYSFENNITIAELFEILEKFGRSHELLGFGYEIGRAYQVSHVVRKLESFDKNLPQFYRFYHDYSYLLSILRSAFCFNLKLEANSFVNSDNFSQILETVYTKYTFFHEDLKGLSMLASDYIGLCQRYYNVESSFAYFLNEQANPYSQDITRVNSLNSSWDYMEGVMWSYLEEISSKGDNAKFVGFIEQYLEILLEDKKLIDELKDLKQIEIQYIKDNYEFELQQLQIKILSSIKEIKGDWDDKILVNQTLDNFTLPTLDTFNVSKSFEFQKTDLSVVDDLENKYIGLFLRDVDLSDLFEKASDSQIKSFAELELLNFYELIFNQNFSDELNDFKYHLFLSCIFQSILGSGFNDKLRRLFQSEYEKYLLNDKSIFDESFDLGKCINFWELNSDMSEIDREALRERILSLVSSQGVLKLTSTERKILNTQILVQSAEKRDNSLCLSNYQVENASVSSLSLRQIQRFMRALNAEKIIGSSSHIKFKVDLLDGTFYSYTISMTTVQSSKYFAGKLLQDLSTAYGDSRLVCKDFFENLTNAFESIGFKLVAKNV